MKFINPIPILGMIIIASIVIVLCSMVLQFERTQKIYNFCDNKTGIINVTGDYVVCYENETCWEYGDGHCYHVVCKTTDVHRWCQI